MALEIVQIEFSKNGEGRILITPMADSLFLEKAKRNDLKIGDKVLFNENNPERVLQLKFHKTETIDVLIEALNDIKNNLKVRGITDE